MSASGEAVELVVRVVIVSSWDSYNFIGCT